MFCKFMVVFVYKIKHDRGLSMKKFFKKALSVVLALTIVFSSAIVGLGEVDFSGLFAIKTKATYSGTYGEGR